MSKQEFPLYEELREKVENAGTSTIDLGATASSINMLSSVLTNKAELKEHYETIFALMYHHELLEKGSATFHSVPYGGQLTDEDTRAPLYTMHNIPPLLQRIIQMYIFTISIPEKNKVK